MVDLVKVRKKAKEKKEKKAEVLSEAPVSSPAPEVTVAPKSAGEDTGAPLNTDKIARFLETAGQRRTVKRVEETQVA
ncbi:MAG: hypothetical protein ACXWH1_14190, partial [Thermoanaerobaculia bacterium]